MADLNSENQNGVFGDFGFGENISGTDNTSFFDGIQQNNNQQNTDNGVKASDIFAGFGVQQAGTANQVENPENTFKPIDRQKAVTKQGLWSRIRSFLFQEVDLTAPIKVELTPYQQKVEDEINEFLHQEVTFKGIAKFFSGK